jgi:hypothetical protein
VARAFAGTRAASRNRPPAISHAEPSGPYGVSSVARTAVSPPPGRGAMIA